MNNVDIIQKLRACPFALVATIAEESGVSEGTLRKIYYGETENPRMDTMDLLREYFARGRGKRRAA